MNPPHPQPAHMALATSQPATGPWTRASQGALRLSLLAAAALLTACRELLAEAPLGVLLTAHSPGVTAAATG